MTEEQIIAYVDGELGPIDALRFERAMETDAALAEAVARHRRLRETIAGHFAPVADAPLPAKLTGLLGRQDNVVAFPARRHAPGPAARYAALAATLVAGLVLGQLLPRGAGGPVEKDGAVVAEGRLAAALDTQLAAAPPQGAPYRIGVSFRATDGRYCRTFTGAVGSGLGCRGHDGWALDRYVAGGSGVAHGDYRQAASGDVEILAAAQAMMAGAPLDAIGEARARDSGWAVAVPRR